MDKSKEGRKEDEEIRKDRKVNVKIESNTE
jgi:hypothetical protein